jgi:acyl-CoA synthetase (AMP-forming)/AMP-acid ligase II
VTGAASRFHDPLYYWARRAPAVLYSAGIRAITYDGARSIAHHWAVRLKDRGIGAGDRVALVSDNDPLAPLAICATSRMGAVTVPLNPRLTAAELHDLIGRSGAKAVLAGPRHAELLTETGVSSEDAALYSFGGAVPGWECLEENPVAGDGTAEADIDGDCPLAVQPFTSGTTGQPKAALVRHDSFVAESMRWQAAGMWLGAGERLYLPLPLTLAAGMCVAFHCMWNGATLVTEPFDAASAAQKITNGDIDAAVLVPTMIHMLLDELDAGEEASPRLRWIFYGAAPMSVPLLKRALARLKTDFYQGYGATEAMALTLLNPEDHVRATDGAGHLLGSVGRPQLGCELRVLDDHGLDAPPGEVGEICSRGPQVFAGYTDEEQTARVFDTSGWYHTGDLGYFDDEGYLYLTDRKDLMIISGGINVSPAEIEAVIVGLEAVQDVAVVGLPHEKWGQQVVAAVKVKPAMSCTEAEVLAACDGRLASYKRPKAVVFVDELPYNANGKLQHIRVRARLAEAMQPGGSGA